MRSRYLQVTTKDDVTLFRIDSVRVSTDRFSTKFVSAQVYANAAFKNALSRLTLRCVRKVVLENIRQETIRIYIETYVHARQLRTGRIISKKNKKTF